jgi:hypothetical protein
MGRHFEIFIISVYSIIFLFIIYSLFDQNLNLKLLIKWGLGIGDWGLGIGDWAQSPIPNPQSPIPNPQSPFISNFKFKF